MQVVRHLVQVGRGLGAGVGSHLGTGQRAHLHLHPRHRDGLGDPPRGRLSLRVGGQRHRLGGVPLCSHALEGLTHLQVSAEDRVRQVVDNDRRPDLMHVSSEGRRRRAVPRPVAISTGRGGFVEVQLRLYVSRGAGQHRVRLLLLGVEVQLGLSGASRVRDGQRPRCGAHSRCGRLLLGGVEVQVGVLLRVHRVAMVGVGLGPTKAVVRGDVVPHDGRGVRRGVECRADLLGRVH
mmetsp:Transcript_41868/g.100738  ORF Transcript_41868/g.100738 Transcript_41868/m.100738 type:complete len:235 (+) Transcript_41868:402-1106(+)